MAFIVSAIVPQSSRAFLFIITAHGVMRFEVFDIYTLVNDDMSGVLQMFN